MKNIVIIGAGDLGRELVWLIEDINKVKPTYVILGFLDMDERKAGREFYGYEVLGTEERLEELGRERDACAVIAIQEGSIRRKIHNAHRGFKKWETIVHPSAVIANSVKIGRGSIFFPQVTVSVDTVLGGFGLDYIHSTVCNDCEVGDYVSVMSGAQISERAKIGEGSFLAAGAAVYPNVVVGRDVRAGVGAVIPKDQADGAEAAGAGPRFAFFK